MDEQKGRALDARFLVDGGNILLIEQEPLEKIKTDVDAVKGVLENLDPAHVAIAVKAIPILLPHAIDHHTPKLERFLKPGAYVIFHLLKPSLSSH